MTVEIGLSQLQKTFRCVLKPDTCSGAKSEYESGG
jgi:hypothetical protein